MPAYAKTPPGLKRGRGGPSSIEALRINQENPIKSVAHGIAEAALAAEKHAPRRLLGTARQGVSPAEHLTKQIEEIGKGVAGRTGASWAEQLVNSHATAPAYSLGVDALTPGATMRLRRSLAASGLMARRVSGLTGLADTWTINQRFAKQLSEIAGIGLANQWDGVLPTGLVAVDHLKVSKPIKETLAATKRMEAAIGKATMPGSQDLVSRGVLARVDQTLLRSPLAGKGFLPADRLASMLAASSTLSTTRLAEVTIGPLAKQIASLGAFTLPKVFVEILERGREIDADIERVAKMWETSALWFLLSILSVGQLVGLARMERADVEAVLLDALEVVVTTGTFTAGLTATVEKAPPYVTAEQRDDLLHGLEHAQAGEFSRAAGALTDGLEGALWSAGRELHVIDADRRLLDKPEKGKIHRVELVVRKLPAEQEFRKFVCGRVFGDLGNPLRHGEQSDRRQRSLFAIVAIAGWIEAFMQVPAANALGGLLSDELSARSAR